MAKEKRNRDSRVGGMKMDPVSVLGANQLHRREWVGQQFLMQKMDEKDHRMFREANVMTSQSHFCK